MFLARLPEALPATEVAAAVLGAEVCAESGAGPAGEPAVAGAGVAGAADLGA